MTISWTEISQQNFYAAFRRFRDNWDEDHIWGITMP